MDNDWNLGDILADVLKEKTGMRVDVQLREPAGEPEYRWKVIRLGSDLDIDWVMTETECREQAIHWLEKYSSDEYDYTLKRVRVESLGKLSPDAKRFLDKLYEKYQPDKIDAIIMVRAAWGLSLKETKDLVEDYLNNM